MKNLVFCVLFLLSGLVCLNSCNMHADPTEDLVVQEIVGSTSGGGAGEDEPE